MKPSGRCPFCARLGQTCWVMPCLSLEQALETDHRPIIREWAVRVGIAIGARDGTWLGSRRLVAKAKAAPRKPEPASFDPAGEPHAR